MNREEHGLQSYGLDVETQVALIALLKMAADDELILGQRSTEWLGMAPDLEEDIAFSSICQDELGHAMFYFELLEGLDVGTVDELALRRDVSQRLNSRLVQLENQDFAFTITRNYLYELFDAVRLEAMQESTYKPLADGVRKIAREEYYHLLHLQSIMEKLAAAGGTATEMVHRALGEIWPFLADLCSLDANDAVLYANGILSLSEGELRHRYEQQLEEQLGKLHLPFLPLPAPQPRKRVPSERSSDILQELLTEMNELTSSVPANGW